MIYIGIDVAHKKHDICILDQISTVLFDGLIITNDKTGFERFIENITRIQKETTDDKVTFALEATGHYNNNILLFLDSLGFLVRIFNPLATNLFRKSLSLKKTKTDIIDAKAIALMLLTNHEEKNFSRMKLIADLKQCTKHRQRLGDKLSQEKVQF